MDIYNTSNSNELVKRYSWRHKKKETISFFVAYLGSLGFILHLIKLMTAKRKSKRLCAFNNAQLNRLCVLSTRLIEICDRRRRIPRFRSLGARLWYHHSYSVIPYSAGFNGTTHGVKFYLAGLGDPFPFRYRSCLSHLHLCNFSVKLLQMALAWYL